MEGDPKGFGLSIWKVAAGKPGKQQHFMGMVRSGEGGGLGHIRFAMSLIV